MQEPYCLCGVRMATDEDDMRDNGLLQGVGIYFIEMR